MSTSLSLCLFFLSSLLLAQRTDTTDVNNGRYYVFQRDALGNPKNPVALYDTNGRLLSHASRRDGLLHGPVIRYDGLGRKARVVTYKKGQEHGPDIYYHPDGTMHWERNNRRGKHHGPSTSYHPNGRVEWKMGFRDGRLHGERILHDTTGALFTGEYLTVVPAGLGQYTTICTNGRPDGVLVVLRGNGAISYTGSYNKGYPDCEFLYHDKDARVYRKEYYAMVKFLRAVEEEPEAVSTPVTGS